MDRLNGKRALVSILAAGAILLLLYTAVFMFQLSDIMDCPSTMQRITGGMLIMSIIFALPLAASAHALSCRTCSTMECAARWLEPPCELQARPVADAGTENSVPQP